MITRKHRRQPISLRLLGSSAALACLLACAARVHGQVVGTSISNTSVVRSTTSAIATVSGVGSSISQAGSFHSVSANAVANASMDTGYAMGHAEAAGSTISNGRSYVRNVSVGAGGGSASADTTAIANVSVSSLYGASSDVVGGTVDGMAGTATEFRVRTGTNGQALASGDYRAEVGGTSDAVSVIACPGVTSTATAAQPGMSGAPSSSFSGAGVVQVSNASGNAWVTPTVWAVAQDGCGNGNGNGNN